MNLSKQETQQLRLVYAGLYIGLGVIPRKHIDTVEAKLHEGVAASDLRWFEPLPRLVSSFEKGLGRVAESTAREKWRWLTRGNSDRQIMRYIRQNGSCSKALHAIGSSIFHAVKYHTERELKRGERYYREVEPDPAYMHHYESGLVQLMGIDKQNNPLLVITPRVHNPKAMPKERLRAFATVIMETAYMCQSREKDGGIILWDMSDFSISKNMDYSVVKFIFTALNVWYPHVLTCMYVHNAPASFEVAWNIIKHWLDPWVVKRTRFTSKTSELLENIPLNQLPRSLGGFRDLKIWSEPNPRDDSPMNDYETRSRLQLEQQDLMEKFESLTTKWVVEGYVDWAKRKELLAETDEYYWKLDPYVRSRTISDRNGVMGLARPELAPGGISQPVCRLSNAYAKSITHSVTRSDSAETGSTLGTLEGPQTFPTKVEGLRVRLSSIPRDQYA